MSPSPTPTLVDPDLDWWLATAPGLSWRTAKTMPDAPHSYVVRDQTLPSEDFDRAVRLIRRRGEPGQFYGRPNLYLADTTVKWWTDAYGPGQVINQAAITDTYGPQDLPRTLAPPQAHTHTAEVYDRLATDYDSRYSPDICPQCEEENQHVRRLVIDHFGPYAPTTLDVGCGTGLLLDLGITAPALYTGIDPSQGMLNQLVLKHPRIRAGHLIPSTLEAALPALRAPAAAPVKGGPSPQPRSFELVTALFGAASYLAPSAIRDLPHFTSSLLLLMHYRPGYLPSYYVEAGDRPSPDHTLTSLEAAVNLPGARVSYLNDLVITTVKPAHSDR